MRMGKMRHEILVTEEAEKDILDIWSHIALNDCLKSADYVLKGIGKAISSLEKMPQRGHLPPELERISVFNYLEVHYKPYRIIYQISGASVFIYCVMDGRRDVQSVLSRRLLKA
jgi:toxin ParE1/3/4